MRSGRGSPKPALAHSLAEFLVINELSSPFHSGKEGGFIETGGWLGLVFLDFQAFGPGSLVLGDRDDGLVILASSLFAINGEPTRLDENFSIRFEGFPLHSGDTGGDFKLRSGIKHRNKTAGDHVVNFQLKIIERLGRNASRDDGMVVGDLGVIENTAIEIHPTRLESLASVCSEVVDLEFAHHIFHIRQIVLRHVTRVGTWIGEDFVFFVEGLGDLERALGTETETRS